jgi:SAM-dependent methyltransferase
VTNAPGEYRLYTELAEWWPLISPPEQYAEDAAWLAKAFSSASIPVRDVLDLGSGGGHVAAHLKARLAMTLVDVSEPMLAVSRELNPECAHVRGDMLTVRLGRGFDAVLVHDAADYLDGEPQLRRLAETAFAHCRPGGIAVFAPDHTAETFRPGTGGGGGSDGAGRQASFREWTSDPDPSDDWILADYEFVLRAADNRVQVVREAHRLASFAAETWRRALAGAGFDPEVSTAPGPDPRARRQRALFLGHRRR